ncbi:amino acid permease [Streptomyces sp. NPDC087218]|uniref:amino acid permease n=1 Tax=Streptomyces sp. NPDC087218 TaxID=3365769 RepID=UPI0038186A1C
MKSPRTTPESQDASTGLKKDLTTPLLYFFILGDVLGAGVYVLVGEVAATAGGAVRAPLLVALCLALLTAASYAELATKYPRAGGASHYATPAYGPFTGFVAGFCMLAAGVVSTPWAAIAATTALSLLLALTGDVSTLASTLVLLLLVVFFLVNTSLLALRRDPGRPGHLRAPAAVPVLGAASCIGLATRIERDVWMRGLVVLAVGAVLGSVAALRLRRAR